MLSKYARPKGTYDILPSAQNRKWREDSGRWQWIESMFRDQCRRFGYREIRTPLFEATALFHRTVGDGTDIVSKETYDFVSRGGDELTLRPEQTAGAIRAAVDASLMLERSVNKLFYIGPNFRYEQPQEGRYHQHHQAGIEALGASDPAIDAEVIALAVSFFQRLGIPRLTVKINNLGGPEVRKAYVDALRDWARPLLPQMSAINRERFEKNALRMLDSKEAQDRALLLTAPRLRDFLDETGQAHFATLQKHLDSLGLAYEIDDFLVRGFDYYTGTTFEIQSPDIGSQSALGGGGRYDNLVEQIGGPATPGIGFGLGLDRILIALEAAQVDTPNPAGAIDAYFCPLGDTARAALVPIVHALRESGLAIDCAYTSGRIKGMFEQAEKCGARWAVIVGDNELAESQAQLRPIGGGTHGEIRAQQTIPLDTLANFLRDN